MVGAASGKMVRSHGHSPQVGNLLTPEWEGCFPLPLCLFGICLVLIPSPKCLVVGAALGEMARRPAHETLLLFPLVAAHHLGQAHIKATHCFYFGLRVLPCDMVKQHRPLFLQGRCAGCPTSSFLGSVYRVSNVGQACSLSGSSAMVKLRASWR